VSQNATPQLRRPATLAAPARSTAPGLLASVVGVAIAVLLHHFVGSVGVLTFAVTVGAMAANLGLLPSSTDPGLKLAVKKLLRVGVVLLGFSVSLAAVASLGLPVIALVTGTLLATLLGTMWLGTRTGLGQPQSLLLATGFAICGASAIAAMQHNADGDEDDVATSVAMVTIYGTLAMIAVPLLQEPLGLGDRQLGIWAGASVHEVGQVIAAAGPAGQTALAIAVTVKLTRVLMLGPVVAAVSFRNRISGGSAPELAGQRPPLVPAFVLGFLLCVLVRSTGILPEAGLAVIGHAQTLILGAALFGLGTAVRLGTLTKAAGPALVVGAVSTVIVATVSLAGVLMIG
jgi:uncharacterized integral membrane protein (TIGR00698 family)